MTAQTTVPSETTSLKGERGDLHDKNRFKEVTPEKPVLQWLLEGIPCSKVKSKHTQEETRNI